MQSQTPGLFSKKSDVRIPAEFEEQEAMVFGCGQLLKFYPQTFVDFVTLLHERIPLFGLVDPSLIKLGEILLGTSGLPKNAVTFLPLKTSSVWVRDYSPITAVDRSGRRVMLKFRHSHMKNRDDIGAFDSLKRNFPSVSREVQVFLEGGNLITNGAGLAISSKTIILQNSQKLQHGEIAAILEKDCGIDQWACLTPLNGERTGHIDLLATFLSPTLLAVAQCDSREDPNNAAILDDLAKAFDGFMSSAGKISVVRNPMPFSNDSYYRSYNNSIFANGMLLVPTYPGLSPEEDRRALAQFAELLPGIEVKGLDCEELSIKGGSLHCMTRNISFSRGGRSPAHHLASTKTKESLQK